MEIASMLLLCAIIFQNIAIAWAIGDIRRKMKS